MPFGDFGNFGGWSPKDQALNKLAYDEAHKKGGGGGGNNNNSGCAVVFVIVIAVILIFLFSQ